MNISRSLVFTATLLTGIALSAVSASAWTGPTASPPSGNVSAPLNVSTADQTKHGWIGLDSLSIFNHMIISGTVNSPNTVRYLNFGSTWDAAGYGIRDNAGTMEFKNSGGSWTSLQSAIYNYCAGGGCGATSQWTTSGSNIYYNTGNIGIGTASPAGKLESDSGGAGVWAGMFNYGGGAPNGAYGLWSHGTSYALYAEGPIVTTGNVNVGSAVLGTNGDLYMPWNGQWLSTRLSNLPGRLGAQFWVPSSVGYSTDAAYAYNGGYGPGSTCPSGSVVAGTHLSIYYTQWENYLVIEVYSLCQWISQ